MRVRFAALSALAVLLAASTTFAQPTDYAVENAALVQILSELNYFGAFPFVDPATSSPCDYLSNPGVGSWPDVSCGLVDGAPFVVYLSLRNYGGDLAGLSERLVELRHLESLDVSGPLFNGPIPASLGLMQSLRSLSISNTAMSGSIPPSLSGLINLRSLRLTFSQFSGLIPISLRALSNLEQFETHGNFPGFSSNLPTAQVQALNDLKRNVPVNWANMNWRDDRDYCGAWSGPSNSWTGVYCDPFLTTVVGIELNGLQMHGPGGSIPSTIGAFKDLQSLVISQSGMTGTLPPSIGSLKNLNQLLLSGNQLFGSLPTELSLLKKLFVIKLENNQFSGTIPSELSVLANLTSLRLGFNQLTGSLPVSFNDMENLFDLDVTGNMLESALPYSQRMALNDIAVLLPGRWNTFPGSDPCLNNANWPGVFCSRSGNTVLALDLQGAGMMGSFPSSVSELVHLKKLILADNSLTSMDFYGLSTLSQLEYLDISNNLLSGVLPDQIEYLPLKFWNFAGNQFMSQIPETQVNALRTLYFSTSSFGWLRPFVDLYSDPCTRNSAWPGVICDKLMRKIIGLDLSQGGLTGTLPDVFTPFGDLRYLNLSFNGLTGFVPESLATLPLLREYDFRFTEFSSRTSPLQRLALMDLYYATNGPHWAPEKAWYNVGTDPCVSGWKGVKCNILMISVIGLDLSSAGMYGTIPDTIGNLVHLQTFNVSNNTLHGRIPSTLTGIYPLYSLDLSNNDLEGVVPEFFPSTMVNVCGNRIVGPSWRLAGCQLECMNPPVPRLFVYKNAAGVDLPVTDRCDVNDPSDPLAPYGCNVAVTESHTGKPYFVYHPLVTEPNFTTDCAGYGETTD